jgi:hypothetical protein
MPPPLWLKPCRWPNHLDYLCLFLSFRRSDSLGQGFDFLTIKERGNLEKAIAQEALKSNIENGICCVAYHDILVCRPKLRCEAYIEDDGACGDLMTPYDYRDGKFKNLDDCVTKSWP